MRSDLNKLLCEHERYRSKDHYKNYRHLKKFNSEQLEQLELLPTRESMKQRYGWNVKQFGENLNPLYGLVRKYAGKKWDEFYSDLCKTFDKRSVINQHILQHLNWYVERNIIIKEDGKIYAMTYSGDLLIENTLSEYFVDPRDGVIKKNNKKSAKSLKKELQEKRKKQQARVFCQIDDNNVLRFIEGVWYIFKMQQIPQSKVTYVKPVYAEDKFNVTPSWSNKPPVFKTWSDLNQSERQRFGEKRIDGAVLDVFLNKKIFKHDNSVFYYPSKMVAAELKDKYHASKRTASHKLLKKMGLV